MRVLLLLLVMASSVEAYGILTHQQIIDQSWESAIVPLLKNRFPLLSADQLKEAHAYAYGGSVIQDLGYYPFSDAFFSDLTHYVRSGDFVQRLFRKANTADEVAFAIGALAHYLGDSIGHSQATNRAVAVEFPRLLKKYGPTVNYGQSKTAHGRVELGFDANQAAKRRLAPYDYVGHIGFEVPWDQVGEAFFETYGFSIHDIVGHYTNARRAYRFGARRFLPAFIYAEALLHQHRLPADTIGPPFDLYKRRTAQLAREGSWDAYRKKPGLGIHVLAGLIVILPKLGPMKVLAIKVPTEYTQSLYIDSVNSSTTALALALHQLRETQPTAPVFTDGAVIEAGRKEDAAISSAITSETVPLKTARARSGGTTLPDILTPNRDLDTGQHVVPGGYRLTDETYAKLLARVTKQAGRPVAEGLRKDILEYYAEADAPISTKRNAKEWNALQKQLQVLRTMAIKPDSLLP